MTWIDHEPDCGSIDPCDDLGSSPSSLRLPGCRLCREGKTASLAMEGCMCPVCIHKHCFSGRQEDRLEN